MAKAVEGKLGKCSEIPEQSVIWRGNSESLAAYAEKIIVLESIGGRSLRLVSNYPYELWCDGQFVGDGGHRCSEGEAISDDWEEAAAAELIQVKLHWIHPNMTQLLCQCLFNEIFIAELTQQGKWAYHFDSSIEFAAQYSAQLPRQNIVVLPVEEEELTCSIATALGNHWGYLDSPIKKARYVEISPVLSTRTVLASQTKGDFSPQQASNIALYVRDERPVDLRCDTYDLQQVALHRFAVESTSASCVLYYSEVADFSAVAGTRFRAKVHLADAVTQQPGNVSLFGTRGCRYVHVLYPKTARSQPQLQVWRREYPLEWKVVELSHDSPASASIVEACKNNLVACVDGGVVDTCWRERAQWTGDLRMSALALRALSTNSEVIDLALHQIAASYNASTGMVSAVWPAMYQDEPLVIPQFHLAFCLAALEHDPMLEKDPLVRKVVLQSLEVWRTSYWESGLVRGMPGWNFTDWDYSDPVATGRDTPKGDQRKPAANAVCNAWWNELCKQLKPDYAVEAETFDAAFWMGKAYALSTISKRDSPQATAAALNCSISNQHSQKSLDYLQVEMSEGRLTQRVTPYFAYFVAKALQHFSSERALDFVEHFYGPISEKYNSIYEKANDEASLAHGWSVGVASILVKPF